MINNIKFIKIRYNLHATPNGRYTNENGNSFDYSEAIINIVYVSAIDTDHNSIMMNNSYSYNHIPTEDIEKLVFFLERQNYIYD